MNRTTLIKNTLQITLRAHPHADVHRQLDELDLPLPTTLQQGLSAHLRASALIVLTAVDAWVGGTLQTRFLASREPAIAMGNPAPNWPSQEAPMASTISFHPLSSRAGISPSEIYSDPHIEVTWVVLTQGAAPVLGPLKTREDVMTALLQLASLPASCLLNVEVFESPPSLNQIDRQIPAPTLMTLGRAYL